MVMAFVAAYFAGRSSLAPAIREHERRDVLQVQQLQALEKERLEHEGRIALARLKQLSDEEARSQATLYEWERRQYEFERGRRGPQLIPVYPPFER